MVKALDYRSDEDVLAGSFPGIGSLFNDDCGALCIGAKRAQSASVEASTKPAGAKRLNERSKCRRLLGLYFLQLQLMILRSSPNLSIHNCFFTSQSDISLFV